MSYRNQMQLSSDETTSDQDERMPIFADETRLYDLSTKHSWRLKLLLKAVYGFNHVANILFISFLLSVVTSLISLYALPLPVYIPFIILWCGHMIVYILLSNIFLLVNESLSHGKHLTDDQFQSDPYSGPVENRLPLSIFVLQLAISGMVFTTIMLISEVLLLLSLMDIASKHYFIIPWYICFGYILLVSIFTTLNHPLQTLSAVFFFATSIALHIYITYPEKMDLWKTLLPLFVLCFIWMFALIIVVVQTLRRKFKLRKRQHAALWFYLSGIITIFVSLLALSSEFKYLYLVFTQKDQISLSVIALIVGLVAFLIASSMDIHDYLDIHAKRMGVKKPLPLKQNEDGDWDVDRTKCTLSIVLLGEIHRI